MLSLTWRTPTPARQCAQHTHNQIKLLQTCLIRIIKTISHYCKDKERDYQSFEPLNSQTHLTLTSAISCQKLHCDTNPNLHVPARNILSAQFTVNKASLESSWRTLCVFFPQVAQKVLKNAKLACSRLGQYRMPFAWAARWARTSWKLLFSSVCVYRQSQYLIVLFCSTGLCLKTPQELWIKAHGSPRCTGRTVINSPKRISSNCWRISGS